MLNTNQETPNQEALASYLKDPQNQIHLNGIPKGIADKVIADCNVLPANEAYHLLRDGIMKMFKCPLRLPTKYYHREKNEFYLNCLGCHSDNDLRAKICPVWEQMMGKKPPCRFRSQKNWTSLDNSNLNTNETATNNKIPFYYNPEAMGVIRTYLSGKRIDLYEAYCKAPKPIQIIYKKLAPIVFNGLQAGKLETDWIQTLELKETICKGCIDPINCSQCLANVLRNETLTLREFSRANEIRDMRTPSIVTDVLANNGFNPEDPNFTFLKEHSGDSRLVAMVTMALVPGWTQGLIVPSLIAPNQECITQPNI